MALTYASLRTQSEGDTYRVFASAVPDTSYPTGGYQIRPQDVGLFAIEEVSVVNCPKGLLFNWDKATSKLIIGDYSGGGGGGLTFTGTPLANHDHTLSMFPLAGHTHSLSNSKETITANPSTFCLVTSASGFFTIGETITGGTSGATATVTVNVNGNPSDIGFTPLAGSFQVGETITGGTSASTATVASGWFSIYVQSNPAEPPMALNGGTRASATGRNFTVTANAANAIMKTTYTAIVGAGFADFETVTGGTSGNTATIVRRYQGGFEAVQVNWSGGAGFLFGETITGGTSGTTAQVTTSDFDDVVSFRDTSSTNPDGDFIIFYPNSVNASPVQFTYTRRIASISSVGAGTPTGTVNPNTAGTPAGTIAGGGGGASFAELVAATNVRAITPTLDIIIEGR